MDRLNFSLNRLVIGKSNEEPLNIMGVKFKLADTERAIALSGESGLGKTSIYKSLFNAYIKNWQKEAKVNDAKFEFDCEHKINDVIFNHKIISGGTSKPNFGFATQIPYFFGYESVEANLFYPLNWLKNEINRKEYLEKFDLSDLKDKKMYMLSGGQRQKVNIARVFLSSPSLVIFDESFSNMDEINAKHYQKLIFQNYPDCIFLITSHRKSDITNFNAKEIKLIRKQSPDNISTYVTIQ